MFKSWLKFKQLRTIFKFYFVFILFLLSSFLNKQEVSAISNSPSLTMPLPERFGTKNISKEWLINPKLENEAISISWLDNNHIIYSLNEKIEIYNINNNMATTIGGGSNPKASPNGQWIAFIATLDNVKQLWLMKKDGSEKRQLTKEGFSGIYYCNYNFAWSYDSNKIAFFINSSPDPDYLAHSHSSLPASSIHIVDIITGTTREVYSDFSMFSDLAWYPNSEKLLMTKFRMGFLYNEDKDTSTVQSVRLSDGFINTLAKFNGLQLFSQPKISPDGLRVSILYNAESEIYSWMLSLGIIENPSTQNNNDSHSIKQLTSDLKLIKSFWSKNGKQIFVVRNYGAYDHIYTVDLQSGELKQLTNDPLAIKHFEVSPDGSKLLWSGENAYGVRIIKMASSDGSEVKNLISDPAYKNTKDSEDAIHLSEVREIEWETFNYPSKMRGLLFLPNHYKPGTRYPLVIDIHGGGEGASISLFGGILTDSPLEWQLWTAKGYAVFVPELRSSCAFGFLAILRDHLQEHNIIHCDIMDVIAGLDELVKQGIVDNNRVAVIGHSAGGRRANWLTVSTDRFKVVISKEGWADERLIAMRRPAIWKQFGGAPLEVPENYLKNSALAHVKGAGAPTLFLMGNPNLGGVDPDKTVYQLYQALKSQGVTTEYVEYLDEGHGFMLPKNRRDALEKTIQWVDYYTSDLQATIQNVKK